MAALRPNPVSNLLIEGSPETPGMSTHRSTSVRVTGTIRPNAKSPGAVRLVVRVSTTKDFGSQRTVASAWGNARDVTVTLTGLAQNTHYYVRAYVDQRNLSLDSTVNAADFWTERAPYAPSLINPPDNITLVEGSSLTVEWEHRDADEPADPQRSVQIGWRSAPGVNDPGGTWRYVRLEAVNRRSYTIPADELQVNGFTEWRIRTLDSHSPIWSPWSEIRSAFVIGSNIPPLLVSPVNGEATPVDVPVTFEWTFRDPSGDEQQRADIRYRAEGTEDWIVIDGSVSPGVPGASDTWDLPTGTFQPGYVYEWQVRTYDDSGSGDPSGWSSVGRFTAILTPGRMAGTEGWLGPTTIQGELGSGTYRVFAYDQGGERLRGEITPISGLTWNRVRDDISSCTITTSGFGEDCCDLLRDLHSWVHEIVVFRDDERVWEGPITLITHELEGVQIQARDVMAYVYRRIMRQGYNDNVRILKRNAAGEAIRKTEPRSVVDRAALIITNALAPHDPNVLPWLTRYDFEDDAREARSVPDWQKTAWEEVDNLAATGGLDYVAAGRRIILFDTHRPIGLLPELRSVDFFTPPILTEYGMSAANVFGVTNNSGIWGSYTVPRNQWGGAGPIEMITSEYGESASTGAPETLTPAQIAAKKAQLNTQAERNAGGRWPPPLVVRIPDNSRLKPSTGVGINQLVPGVHVPLWIQTRCMEMRQMQKLDSLTVTLEEGEEQVQVVLSPAPREGVDPDSDAEVEV